MDNNYVCKHAIRVKNPESEMQRRNSKWRIASNCDFEYKYPDFDQENDTLTGEQEAEVMAIIDEVLKAEINNLAWELARISDYVFPLNYDFFSSHNPRAEYYKNIAVRAFELIHKVRIDNDERIFAV